MSNCKPVFTLSLLRIVAAGLIFLFHFLGLSNLPTYKLDYVALTLFLFISGWFSLGIFKIPSHTWLFKRLKRIMIPYWGVIVPVLIANRIVDYKETSIFSDLLVFLGLGLFVDNPVYVISWFITLIVYYYILLFIIVNAKYVTLRLSIIILGYFAAILIFNSHWAYYFGFFIGLASHIIINKFSFKFTNISSRFYESANSFVFSIQNYSYSFFLTQGAALIFTFKVLNLGGVSSLLASLTLTGILTYIHHNLLKKIS
ncbi:acyltransferase family protein [Desulfonatronum thiodismutans]|uniref:acyltransferase family protein n=1 Tax=Desulfonatronum thiodismutans TaxID=159290 RepID=UPI001377A49A|nr:acyltransferase family protein [Desulfonatronum thiodismutans]